MNFTGRAGQASCACAAKDRTSSATQSKIRFMNLSYMHVHSMRVASGEEALVARVACRTGCRVEERDWFCEDKVVTGIKERGMAKTISFKRPDGKSVNGYL